MTKHIRLTLALAASVFLAGCAGMTVPAPTPEDIQKAQQVPKPNMRGVAVITSKWLEGVLIDPYSARPVRCAGFAEDYNSFPHLAYSRKEQRYVAGYVVQMCINAKNRMGGYTGPKKYSFFFVEDRLYRVWHADRHGFEPNINLL